MNLQEIITAKVPGAVYTEAGDGMFTIPVEQFHDLARYLHDDPALRFDFLRSLTGMDWGEEGLGAVYHLESTATGENVVLKVLTPSREQCGLPTVSDIWKGAELNEREVFDFFGIGFINHPDMRRLYLRDDWVGYPLRKDYDQSGETNPLRMTNEVAHDSSPSYELQPDGSIIRRRNVLFEEDEYVINIGPQHPATHGVLRFRVSLEGEIIKKLDVHCGYIHRVHRHHGGRLQQPVGRRVLLRDTGGVSAGGAEAGLRTPLRPREDGVRLRPGGIGPDPADGPGAGEDVH